MSNFFPEFNHVSKEQWADKIHADLKGKSPSLLEGNDLIEELNFSSFYHHSDRKHSETPGTFPYTRGMIKPKNEWKNGVRIQVDNEQAANKSALRLLMNGADFIWFEAKKATIDWKLVLTGIEFEHIHTQFSLRTAANVSLIKTITGDVASVQFNLDLVGENSLFPIKNLSEDLISQQQRFLLVNGFSLQQTGATTWQEIAYCLNAGHEYLIKLLDCNYTIDQAAACIAFHVGIGSNYFYEIAKIRALKQLWSKIIAEYKPANIDSYNCSITAVIGHINKSLADPNTNLLRQTTESMSALAGGVDQIVVLPYDTHSNATPSELAARMALNIPLILKEESYFDLVIDPVGGSYSLEQLTEMIATNAWSEFQQIENDGGLMNSSARTNFTQRVNLKRTARIEHFENDKQVLIGINKYLNPEKSNESWQKLPDYLGIEGLNFEMIAKNVSA